MDSRSQADSDYETRKLLSKSDLGNFFDKKRQYSDDSNQSDDSLHDSSCPINKIPLKTDSNYS